MEAGKEGEEEEEGEEGEQDEVQQPSTEEIRFVPTDDNQCKKNNQICVTCLVPNKITLPISGSHL